ncbi:MAG: 4Fe-4S binding protein [Candidatus Omnitrophica bacterium]|nr:4Fe-4S binding protein [Candidatus Omnitrophota bacterium]
MPRRKIIKIDEGKCNGCGLCVPNCPEGAMQIIDGKARLISDLFCDGLGACIGHCPQGAITIEEREAEEYDEYKVMANVAKQGGNVINAHLLHLKEHDQTVYFNQAVDYLKKNNIKVPDLSKPSHAARSGCPGSKLMDFRKERNETASPATAGHMEPQLRQWPIQITLVPPFAPYLRGADLLIAADCVPFAYADFHNELLKGKVVLVGCPKLDDVESYKEKFAQILQNNEIKSITYAHMEVPCCFGLVSVIQSVISDSGKKVPFKEAIISIQGERLK